MSSTPILRCHSYHRHHSQPSQHQRISPLPLPLLPLPPPHHQPYPLLLPPPLPFQLRLLYRIGLWLLRVHPIFLYLLLHQPIRHLQSLPHSLHQNQHRPHLPLHQPLLPSCNNQHSNQRQVLLLQRFLVRLQQPSLRTKGVTIVCNCCSFTMLMPTMLHCTNINRQ